MKRALALASLAVVVLLASGESWAQGSLNVYCSVQAEWCQAIATEFQRQTGIKVAISQKGSGEVLAQITAEAANPKGDLWFGGTGDPHLQAAEQNLTLAYRSPNLDKLHDWARRQAEQSGRKTVGIYAGALGFGYNPELLQKKKLAPPACWKDLLKKRLPGRDPDREPELLGHGLCRHRHDRPALRRGGGLRLSPPAAQERQPVHALGHRPHQGGGAGRDLGQHQLHARRRHRDARRLPRQGRGPLRGHGLRDRVDEHHQGRAQSRQRAEVLRLGADRACPEAWRRRQAVPVAIQRGRPDPAPGAEAR